MNALSKSEVLLKIFATLDTTVRKSGDWKFTHFVDNTVGFIRKLPTQLVESFKSAAMKFAGLIC